MFSLVCGVVSKRVYIPNNPEASVFDCSCVSFIKKAAISFASVSEILLVLMLASSRLISTTTLESGSDITSLMQVSNQEMSCNPVSSF
jgi:hypothetical protein